jgi:hypothetical protein
VFQGGGLWGLYIEFGGNCNYTTAAVPAQGHAYACGLGRRGFEPRCPHRLPRARPPARLRLRRKPQARSVEEHKWPTFLFGWAWPNVTGLLGVGGWGVLLCRLLGSCP